MVLLLALRHDDRVRYIAQMEALAYIGEISYRRVVLSEDDTDSV